MPAVSANDQAAAVPCAVPCAVRGVKRKYCAGGSYVAGVVRVGVNEQTTDLVNIEKRLKLSNLH